MRARFACSSCTACSRTFTMAPATNTAMHALLCHRRIETQGEKVTSLRYRYTETKKVGRSQCRRWEHFPLNPKPRASHHRNTRWCMQLCQPAKPPLRTGTPVAASSSVPPRCPLPAAEMHCSWRSGLARSWRQRRRSRTSCAMSSTWWCRCGDTCLPGARQLAAPSSFWGVHARAVVRAATAASRAAGLGRACFNCRS